MYVILYVYERNFRTYMHVHDIIYLTSNECSLDNDDNDGIYMTNERTT